MCWKCEEIDRQIEHYRRLSAQTSNERSVRSLDILVARLEADKKASHIAGFE
jgi:hypothetical protein